jgi:hypothetical protein
MTLHVESPHVELVNPIAEKASPTWRNRLISGLKALGNFVFLVLAEPSEPVITQACDRTGHCYWHVYDPRSQQDLYFARKLEVLQWLEERPYY